MPAISPEYPSEPAWVPAAQTSFPVGLSLLDHEYNFERQGREVAQVSIHWFSWTDTYGVDVVSGEDDVLILATAVVIDMVCHQESKSK